MVLQLYYTSVSYSSTGLQWMGILKPTIHYLWSCTATVPGSPPSDGGRDVGPDSHRLLRGLPLPHRWTPEPTGEPGRAHRVQSPAWCRHAWDPHARPANEESSHSRRHRARC